MVAGGAMSAWNLRRFIFSISCDQTTFVILYCNGATLMGDDDVITMDVSFTNKDENLCYSKGVLNTPRMCWLWLWVV